MQTPPSKLRSATPAAGTVGLLELDDGLLHVRAGHSWTAALQQVCPTCCPPCWLQKIALDLELQDVAALGACCKSLQACTGALITRLNLQSLQLALQPQANVGRMLRALRCEAAEEENLAEGG
jgi:hypothetical protein